MKILLKRTFERTRQIADFVPVKIGCEVSGEIELEDTDRAELLRLHAFAEQLFQVCESEVEHSISRYWPSCILCGGKGQKSPLNKEGLCGQCVKELSFQLAELKKETKK